MTNHNKAAGRAWSANHSITLCLSAKLGGSYHWLFMWVTCPN